MYATIKNRNPFMSLAGLFLLSAGETIMDIGEFHHVDNNNNPSLGHVWMDGRGTG